jgi:hypothetical protein
MLVSKILGLIRWWRWLLRAPRAPELYNDSHPAGIDAATFERQVERWLAAEPTHRPQRFMKLTKERAMWYLSGKR